MIESPTQLAGLDRWKNCQFGTGGANTFENMPPRPDYPDYQDAFLCTNPEVVEESRRRLDFFRKDGLWLQTAVLHSAGRESDEAVQKALDKACGKCPFYQAIR